MHLVRELASALWWSALLAAGATIGFLHLAGAVREPGLIGMLFAIPAAVQHPLFYWLWAGVFVVGLGLVAFQRR